MIFFLALSLSLSGETRGGERASRECCFHLGYPGLWWPNPNSIRSPVSGIRMNCGSVWQMIHRKSEIGFWRCTEEKEEEEEREEGRKRRRRGSSTRIVIKIAFFCLFAYFFWRKGRSQGPLFLEGRPEWNFTEADAARFSLAHTDLRGRIPCAPIYSMYLFYAFAHAGDGWTSSGCCAFQMVRGLSCVNILSQCQKKCDGNVKKKKKSR